MSKEFRVLATRCGSCGCGCPTIMEGPEDSIVIIGSISNALVEAAAVREKTGSGESAVVIPKSLLIEAFHLLHAE
jgi:hypothetical protein